MKRKIFMAVLGLTFIGGVAFFSINDVGHSTEDVTLGIQNKKVLANMDAGVDCGNGGPGCKDIHPTGIIVYPDAHNQGNLGQEQK